MSELKIEDVRRVARDAVDDAARSLRLVGVTLGDTSKAHVDIMVVIEGCSASRCIVDVRTATSSSDAALREQITRELVLHVMQHRSET